MTLSIPKVIVGGLILTMVSVAGGCVSGPKNIPTDPMALLSGTSWQLGKIGDQPVLEDTQPTLQFAQGGQVSGSGSCNRFSGTVKLSGETITFGPLAATRMACADPINAQETQYFYALSTAQRFVLQGNSLQIYTSTMDLPLLYVRMATN
jgi:heat shock protein HslJ